VRESGGSSIVPLSVAEFATEVVSFKELVKKQKKRYRLREQKGGDL
jgi:hypothetical protein